MATSTRRGFIALSASGVATGVVAASAAPGEAADLTHPATDPTDTASGPVLAYVHDAARGEVAVLRGETEVVVHDPALVRLLNRHV